MALRSAYASKYMPSIPGEAVLHFWCRLASTKNCFYVLILNIKMSLRYLHGAIQGYKFNFSIRFVYSKSFICLLKKKMEERRKVKK